MQTSVNLKKHILLVDDEKDATRILCMLLETRGYHVQVAHTAREAFGKVSSDLDLIILDLVLPDCHGFDVCRRLKEGENTCDIPIIILSAHSLEEDKVEGLYLGADDFLAKPCEYEELFARMEVVMRRNSFRTGNMSYWQEGAQISELRRILDEADVVPYFQPIYALQPFRLLGVEILTRPKTDGVLANPEVFFKVALQYGMYAEVELLAWSMALSQISGLQKEENVFFNCNPYFIESPQFLRAKAMFESHHISPKNVILEITERSQISDFGLFYENLTFYRKYGFQFAVDDVGGGYASLETIAEIRPEVVKIDRQIVKDLSKDSLRQSIVKFIASFCKEHNIISVAEGIETQEDLDTVRSLSVDAVQGYFLFRPTSKFDMNVFRAVKK